MLAGTSVRGRFPFSSVAEQTWGSAGRPVGEGVVPAREEIGLLNGPSTDQCQCDICWDLDFGRTRIKNEL